MIWLSDKNAATLPVLKKTYNIGGRNISFEAGKLALLANGSVTISDELGNMLLVTAGIKEKGVNEKAPFFPLVVDYQDKFYATWKIGGNKFQKREGRPSESAVLISRLIDRPIRPMFADGFVNDTQIMVTPLSLTPDSDLGFFGVTGASLSLMMAGAPFEGPVSGVKIALMHDGSKVFDPTFEQLQESKLNVTVAGTLDAITMVEADWKEVSDEEMVEMLEYSHSIIKDICNAQLDYFAEYKELYGYKEIKGVYQEVDKDAYVLIKELLTNEKLEALYGLGKKDFLDTVTAFEEEVVTHYDLENEEVESPIEISEIPALVNKRIKERMRENIIENEKRLDGRAITEVRQIIGEVGLVPRVHGSALFRRGMTQALTLTTLGWPDDVQIVDDMFEESEKRYLHHYNFPPFSVGDVRPLRGVWRREIGHGKLAEKALEPVLPTEAEFPYVMRVVSEITTCNGSSSMASVCGSSMSLMQAGVPIKTPVAGIAMGMIYDENTGEYKILSDIQAQEDFLWDMDFKVARTENGITAMQLDVKIKGLSMDVFRQAFAQSKDGINHILGEMNKAISTHSPELSPYAPSITSFYINPEKISSVIGRGGENVQRMERDYEVRIHIEDDGKVNITAKDKESTDKAVADIEAITWEPKVESKHTWVVTKILEGIGALVEFRGKTGMIHISKLQKEKTNKVEDVVNVGDEVLVEIITVDLAKGKIGLKLEENKSKKA